MLAQIRVQNIALIDEVTVDLEEQLNILTGETGAGKSILLGAINLALGARNGKDVVRDPEKPAGVDLLFIEQNPKVLKKLEELGISLEIEEGGTEILISRRIGSNGRGTSRINGETVVAAQVRQAAALLIDIHGQHEHQSLLNEASHIEILDRFSAPMGALREQMKRLWEQNTACRKELEHYTENEREKERLLALRQFESDEIEQAALREGEEEELQEQRQRLLYAGRLREDSQIAYEALRSQSEGGASDQISTAVNRMEGLQKLDGEFFTARTEALRDALAVVEDVAADLLDYAENIEEDDGQLDAVEERLDLIHRLKNKYGRTQAEIQQYKIKNDEEMQKLLHIQETIADLRAQQAAIEAKMRETAEKMTQLRQEQAERVGAEITDILTTLQFTDPIFRIQVEPAELSAKGADKVTFLIRTNVGDDIKPLSKVASGGEISRVMLAIKTVLASQDEIETLIFDEIDTGISGRTAQSVAEKMSRIARYRQVIAVTHLPQIAAMADVHLCIEKSTEQGRTYTHVHKLKPAEQVQEIARLLGGLQVTEAVTENAREMKKLAEDWKKKNRV